MEGQKFSHPRLEMGCIMKFDPLLPPRKFQVGKDQSISLSDCGRVTLDEDEQVTFVTNAGGEYDVARKSWGFYATPSVNKRLPSFGLRAALAKSADGTVFVWLVESGREEEMKRYAERYGLRVTAWLDDQETLAKIERSAARVDHSCPCGANDFVSAHVYTSPPEGEVRFQFAAQDSYRRELLRCGRCGHFISVHDMTKKEIYDGEYVDATYGGSDGLLRSYQRIMSLPPEQSDNVGRVDRIVDFISKASPSVLDVGSGLCVFLARLKERGWKGTALDPDPRAVEHARRNVGIEAVCGTLDSFDPGRFDVVTLNKVIEHVRDPVAFLRQARRCVKEDGFMYIEAPDGEGAWKEGPGREEFFIEHLHIYSAASLALTVRSADLDLLELERLREPSGKFTLRAFASPA